MEISYLGHSSFKIKTKTGTVVTDPFGKMAGFAMPSVSCDIVTISHDHEDHNNVKAVTGTARRKDPFVIAEPGEYEVEGVSVFGYRTYHDGSEGSERGGNVIYVIQAEDLRVLHLGDLGHTLTDKLVEELDGIDVVMVPVGGVFTIDAKQAVKVVEAIDPYYVLPMHYITGEHDQKVFGGMEEVENFTKLYGRAVRKVKSLSLSKISLAQDATEVILFE